MDYPYKYKRVLLKLTGESFGGDSKKGFDFETIDKMAKYLHTLKDSTGIELAIVVGGGNFFRGREAAGTNVDNATADYIGMLATVMNTLALQEALERYGSITRVMSPLYIQSVCEPFVRRKAIRHLEKGRIVILGGGTGNPFFTTDSGAALKACELKCEIILKASNVDGIYNTDPKLDSKATLYKRLTYQEALEKGLTVMDNTAFALCQREKIPIVLFNISHLENIEKIMRGEEVGTLVTQG
ncbi:UMP kinase [Candidatus Roizmanbacteria bacterium]|nr:UMP kinase [Candidatus Roizmanbacteria bacterium]